jgi:riboflavin kinase
MLKASELAKELALKDFVGEKEWFFLYWIALHKHADNTLVSTPELCQKLDISQQTISRRIIELEKAGFITRSFNTRGGELDITPKGYIQLESIYKNLHVIFTKGSCIETYTGLLQTGLGEGASYIKNPKYLVQFKEKLGFHPFFGTLNVHLEPALYNILQEQLKNTEEIVIEGFRDQDRAYGEVRCIKTEIWANNQKHRRVMGALLRIQRTSHDPYLLEFIAEKYMRDYFKLVDGDEIQFQI